MKNAETPLVSVFMPCFNQERYVAQAMESVLSQDYPEIQLVVGDDCSTDGTWAIVSHYQSKYPDKIVAFRNERNLGITGNCNELLRRCTGKYIAFHAGDDLFLPGKLSIQIKAMERTGAILSFHNVEAFNSQTNETLSYWNSGRGSVKPIKGDCQIVGRHVIEYCNTGMAAQSLMVRRDAVPSTGYDERIRTVSDWLMCIDICLQNRGTVEYLPIVLARYRRHAENTTSKLIDYFGDQLLVLAIAESRYPSFAASIERGHLRLRYAAALYHLYMGDEKVGRHYLRRSMRCSAYFWKAPVRLCFSILGLNGILASRHRLLSK